MKNTVRDFWKMIMDNKVSAIVMCCREQEKGRVRRDQRVSIESVSSHISTDTIGGVLSLLEPRLTTSF